MKLELQMLDTANSNLEWFCKNYPKLKEGYGDRFIAVKNQKIIASDKHLKSLVEELISKKEDPSEVFIKFVNKVTTIF